MGRIRVWAMVVWCAACGPSLDVDRDKRLTSLSDSEIRDLCEYMADVYDEERIVQCGGPGQSVRIPTVDADQCVAAMTQWRREHFGCPATVEQHVACNEAHAHLTDAQLCEHVAPPECAPWQTPECN